MLAAGDVSWETEGLVADGLPDGWRRHAHAAHLDLIHRWVGPLGDGTWLKTDLQEERSDVRGLVPDLEGRWIGIDVAWSVASTVRTDIASAAADVRRLPFADGSIDGILSTSTLDHFEHEREIDAALAELRRVLRPDGMLLLTLDNPQNPLIRLRNALPPAVRTRTGLAPFHVGPTLSESAGISALHRTGFGVTRTEHLLHAPHIIGTRAAAWPWFETRALPVFDRLARTRVARFSGHYVAFLASPAADASSPRPEHPTRR